MCREQQQVISFNDRYSGKMGGWQTDAVSACLAEYRRKAFALIFMDLDFFKPVNDTYGHPAGDEVLCNVGKRIINSIRTADYAFRIGGDEFACIIDGNADEKNCLESIERLQKVICNPYNIHGHKIKIGVSCGYVLCPSDADTVESLLKIADSRMYAEKEKHHADRR